MPWLDLKLELDPAGAEAFSEALLAAGAESVWLDRPDAPVTVLHALLSADADAGAVTAAAAATAGLPIPRFMVQAIGDEDWVRKSQAQFQPILIGARLWIGPTWHEPPTGRAVVRIDPGLAFGTGTHATTRLTLAFLERVMAGGERVLDYGCGSGILAIAAAKLGAGRVDAVDLDPLAVETTAANALANGVALQAALPDALAAQAYDIVLANILAQPLVLLAPLLAARTAPAGRIALSGILESQAAEVMNAYTASFQMTIEALEEGWALLGGRRRTVLT